MRYQIVRVLIGSGIDNQNPNILQKLYKKP